MKKVRRDELKLIWIFVIFFNLIHTISTTSIDRKSLQSRNNSMKQFIKTIFNDYDNTLPPSFFTGIPTLVNVSIMVHGLSSISVINMDYSINMYLRQYWTDTRLAYHDLGYNESLTLNSMKDKMWVPDLYFINEKKGHFHSITTPNLLLRLTPYGDITFSQKLTVVLSCPMQLYKFPMDTQYCVLEIESYGYTTKELMFHWIKGVDDEGRSIAIQFSDKLELPEFEPPKQETTDCTMYYLTGSYSCLRVKFVLKRKFGFYFVQIYIPSILIVILSWLSFWIDVQAVPARISLGLLTVLSMTTQSTGARGDLPRVSYVKAIDVWMSTCLIFVFGALIEFAIANVLSRRVSIKKDETSDNNEISQGESQTILSSNTEPNDCNLTFVNHQQPTLKTSGFHINGRNTTENVTMTENCDNSKKCMPKEGSMVFVPLETTSSLHSSSVDNIGSRDVKPMDQTNAVKVSNVRHRLFWKSNDSATSNARKHSYMALKAKFESKFETTRNKGDAPLLGKLSQADMVDQLARFIFPLAFVFFNFFYWLYYLYIEN